ncbi:MAG: SDR family NAD(P)-dependent oxidoreductase [Candidatus Limnocylindrales bacterium]
MASQLADLTHSVVLVTGAGGGLGRAFALEFARRGASVAVNDVDTAAAEGTVQTIAGAGGTARAFVADVTDARAVAGMMASIEREIGPLQVLVNNAGITRFEGEAYLGMDDWRRIVEVNVNAVWNCTREALPGMMGRRDGSILNVSSVAVPSLDGSSTAYIVSKGAVETMTKALARRCAPHVQVNAVAPGSMETTWYDHYYPADERVRPHRFVRVEDVVQIGVTLVATKSVTGQIVVVDAAERFGGA